MRSIPDPGRSHTPWDNEACAPQLLSLCSRAQEVPLLKPERPRACAPQEKPCNEKPAHTAREQPLLAATREKPAQQRRPGTANNMIINFKTLCKKVATPAFLSFPSRWKKKCCFPYPQSWLRFMWPTKFIVFYIVIWLTDWEAVLPARVLEKREPRWIWIKMLF